jgi:hypothetical protein
MSAAQGIGVSYTRFSDPVKQSKGDSQDRQDRMFREFCQRHRLTPLPEVFADRGRSGYKDEHRRKGRFGQLVAMAKEGASTPAPSLWLKPGTGSAACGPTSRRT